MAQQKRKPIPEPPDALAAFARVFLDEAIRQVEEKLEAEEKAKEEARS